MMAQSSRTRAVITPIKIKIDKQNANKDTLRDGGGGSGSDDKPTKRRKINEDNKNNNKKVALSNEFDQEFGDVQSLFLSSDLAPRRQNEHERTSEVSPGLDSLFLPFQEARRLRIPEVLWIYSNPGFQDCPLDIPDHKDEEKEPLPKAIWRNVPHEVAERMRQEM